MELHLGLWLLLFLRVAVSRDVPSCGCGFYDDELDAVFTDSSIVYFNETDGIPTEDLVVEKYEHRYDLGWNTLYREGAAVENAAIVNDTTARNLTSLQLTCNPSTSDHLVEGASIRTARQDIFFGSFRASMRAPRPWLQGSALSMVLHHNQTERWDVDIMNTDSESGAWVSTLMQGEFSNLYHGTNFSALLNDSIDPWYYTEYRVDWTRESIDYYIGGQLQRSFTKEMNGTLPSTPAALHWKHWSTGNLYSTQGPPGEPSPANIAWTRIFFNSSHTTKEQRQAFDARCTPADACRMTDNTLRGSTAYREQALKHWKQSPPKYGIPLAPLIIDIIMAVVFVFVVTKTLWRRASWAKVMTILGGAKGDVASSNSSVTEPRSDIDSETLRSSEYDEKKGSVSGSSSLPRNESFQSTVGLRRDSSYASFDPPPIYSGMQTPAPQYRTPAMSRVVSRVSSQDDLTIEPVSDNRSWGAPFSPRSPPRMTTAYREDFQGASNAANPFVPPSESGLSTPAPEAIPQGPMTPGASTLALSTPLHGIPEVLAQEDQKSTDIKAPITENKAEVVAVAAAADAKPAPVKRVDYLAGFIGLSAVLVTLNHFGLTFFAAVIEPSVSPHYQSETWARRTIATYFFDPLWIGPFLMISTRFLTSNYLRTAKLDNMAQKIVVRPFRLLTPVASIALLEYFLMDAGALAWLEYLPSVTWSSWPYTTIVANPGVWLSEIIQLAFLIPNAAPMITYNYCTGVLWTIPVQLQGAWQTLWALIMIREIKTPWKRTLFYAFCIANHWYALSWGSYYYAGLALADLELTFKWSKWLRSHPWVYYPFLNFLIVVALGAFTIDMVVQWTGVNYAEFEYGWHPDTATGLTISQAGRSVYPDYFVPRLNALIATVSMQAIVEINPTIQKILSVKFLQYIFPHIFTIYLIHGFIFWSVGSWAMVSLFSYGLPYWLCVLLTAIISYGTLFCSLPLLTPPIEAVGKKFTMSLWEKASEEPVPRKGTTWPFGKELLSRELKSTGEIREEQHEQQVREEQEVLEKGKQKRISAITEKEIA